MIVLKNDHYSIESIVCSRKIEKVNKSNSVETPFYSQN